MSGIKFEELTEIEKELFNDLKKILNQENWFDLFAEKDVYPNSHIKLNVLRQLAKTFKNCFLIKENGMFVKEEHLLSVIHTFRLGDAYYVKFTEKLILNYPKEDLVVFIACLLLEKKDKMINKDRIRSYLKRLPVII